MNILVTGFDPFDNDDINPSWEVVKSLPDRIGPVRIVKKKIPTVFGKSNISLIKHMEECSPDIVILVGLAGGRASISVERVAINIDDAGIEDNDGNKPVDEAVFNDGPAAYFSNLPIKSMVKEINDAGIPADVSNSAGTFVCNHLMYSLLHYITENNLSVRGGFIHIPFLPSQVCGRSDLSSMSAESVRTGLLAAIDAAVNHKTDLKISYGREC